MNKEFEKTIEELAAGLAHEVKNPLSLVRANIDLLELCDMTGEFRSNYFVMRREVERINSVIMDFIQITRNEGITKEKTASPEIIDELFHSFKETYKGKICFVLEDTTDGIVLNADRSKISQAVMNLMRNAVDAVLYKLDKKLYLDEKPLVRIKLYKEENFFVVEVTDNGKGIAEEENEKLGKLFFTTKKGGSGIGLYTVNKIVSEHNGKFLIEGLEGNGCMCRIFLPLH